MPLLDVRALVQHASRHGYIVSSFSARGADEVQAVVTAAEANRAPAIIAVDGPGGTFANADLRLVVAEAFAARATVPIGIEVVTRGEQDERRIAWSTARGDRPAECGEEIWPSCAALADPVRADRVGVAIDPEDCKTPHIGALRKKIERIRNHFGGPLVIDGDVTWRDGTLPALPKMGVAKINFDHRLRRAMAAANRRAARDVGDDFRRAMEDVAAALVTEVTECLRRTGGTGRAADVLAYAGGADTRNIQAIRDAANARRVAAPISLVRPRSMQRDDHLSFA